MMLKLNPFESFASTQNVGVSFCTTIFRWAPEILACEAKWGGMRGCVRG
jgi:hypothetical protein